MQLSVPTPSGMQCHNIAADTIPTPKAGLRLRMCSDGRSEDCLSNVVLHPNKGSSMNINVTSNDEDDGDDDC